MKFIADIKPYLQLMRLDKPIGISLLLWPTLWALWLASGGIPSDRNLFIFIAGVILSRSAGCILNDFADRQVDGKVKRTLQRPFVTGQVSLAKGLSCAGFLLLIAFGLVLCCNFFTIQLSFIALLLAIIYPFLKRITHLPQVGLGLAFSWGVPMAFAAAINHIPPAAWLLFATAMIWPVIYDTFYAMVDRVDDVKAGVKSTAILFANKDRFITGGLQCFFLALMMKVGEIFYLHTVFYISLGIVAGLFIYQQWLIRNREAASCFRAFKNNHWVGICIFLGILFSFLGPIPRP